MKKDVVVVKKDSTYEDDINTIKDVSSQAFLISGKILASIQEGKKYKDAGYKSFSEAIKIDLGMKVNYAYKLIKACTIYENLCTRVHTFIPTEENQIRSLSLLEPEQQIEVWQEVAKDKVPTAREVQAAVNIKLGKVKVVKAKVAPVENPLMPMLLAADHKNHELLVIVDELQKRVAELEAQLKKESTTVKESKTHEEERAEFLNKRKKVKNNEVVYFQKRLKEDGIIS